MNSFIQSRREVTGAVKNRKRWKAVIRHKALYMLMVPGLLYLIINNYIPMFGVIIAFKNYNYAKGILRSDWIGFENFKYLFATNDALLVTWNTLLYNAVFITVNLFLSVTMAISLYRQRNRVL